LAWGLLFRQRLKGQNPTDLHGDNLKPNSTSCVLQMMERTKMHIDWAAVEAEFRAGLASTRQIARDHGISEGAIRKRAKRANWVRASSRKKTAGPIALVPPSGLTAQQLASERVDLAVAVLADVCANGRSGIARVRAAKIIMALAEGKPIRPAASKRNELK
jgi:hypothetical protein